MYPFLLPQDNPLGTRYLPTQELKSIHTEEAVPKKINGSFSLTVDRVSFYLIENQTQVVD